MDQELSTVLPVRGDPKPPPEPKTPRVVELLRKAIEWKALIESGKIATQAEIARQEGITRARVTQVMSMLRLRRRFRSTFCPCPSWFRDPRFHSGRFDLLNPHRFPHHPLKVACLHGVCSPFGFRKIPLV